MRCSIHDVRYTIVMMYSLHMLCTNFLVTASASAHSQGCFFFHLFILFIYSFPFPFLFSTSLHGAVGSLLFAMCIVPNLVIPLLIRRIHLHTPLFSLFY